MDFGCPLVFEAETQHLDPTWWGLLLMGVRVGTSWIEVRRICLLEACGTLPATGHHWALLFWS